MDTDVTKQTPFLRLPFWIRWSLILWLLIGVAPVACGMFGIQYIPSPEWVSLVRIPAAILGAIMAGLMTWGVALGLKLKDQEMGKAKKFLVVCFTPVMGFVIGGSAVTLGGPMIGATIAGAETEIAFTVTKFERSVDRKCPNPISLDGLPWVFDRLCGFPKEFGRSLERGGQVLVIGKGTGMGVIVKSARKVE